MTPPNPPRAARLADLRALARLLEAQPDSLTELAPDRIGPVVRRVQDLCDRIEAVPDPASPAEARLAAVLQARAAHAQRRLAARIAGLRDAQALLAGLHAQSEARTYGPEGRTRPLEAPVPRLERRS